MASLAVNIFEKRKEEELLRARLQQEVLKHKNENPDISNKDLMLYTRKLFSDTTFKNAGLEIIRKILNGTFSIKDKRGQRNFDDDQHVQLVCMFKFLGEFGVVANEAVQTNVANNFLKINVMNAMNSNSSTNSSSTKPDKSLGKSWYRSFNNIFKDFLKPDHIPPHLVINPDLSAFHSMSENLVNEWSSIVSRAVVSSGLGRLNGDELEIIHPDCIFTVESLTLQGSDENTNKEPVYLPLGDLNDDIDETRDSKCVTGIFSTTLSNKFLKPLISLPKSSINSNDEVNNNLSESAFISANGTGWATGKVFLRIHPSLELMPMRLYGGGRDIGDPYIVSVL